MPGVDTSIYANSGHPVDPYAAVNNALAIKNAVINQQLLQNQLQGSNMDLAAKQGVGEAFSSAVGPNGEFDANKFNQGAASGGARILGPAIISDSANAAYANTSAATAATKLSQDSQAWLSSNVYPLFNDPKNPPKSADISAVITNGINSGAIDRNTGNALTLEMLKNSRDPATLKKWAQTKFVGSMGTGQSEPGAAISSPAGTTVLSKGQAAVAGQGGSAGAGISTTPPVNVLETYKAANDQKNADYGTAAASLGNVRNLEAAYDKLGSLDPSDAGAVGDAKNKVLNLAVALHLAPSTAPMTREEAEKYLEKSVANLPAAARSDMAQHLADVSNPSLKTSLEATRALTRSAIGFARMDAAIPYAWDSARPGQVAGQTDPSYLKHRATFMGSQDPDAYSFDLASPTEQRKILAEKQKGGAASVERFLNSIDTFKKARPSGANP